MEKYRSAGQANVKIEGSCAAELEQREKERGGLGCKMQLFVRDESSGKTYILQAWSLWSSDQLW